MAKVKDLIIKKDFVDIGLLIDESGSMAELKSTVISQANNFIKEQKEVGGNAYITITKFNSEIKKILDREKISEARKITNKDYVPCATTALYDGICNIIRSIEKNNTNDKVVIAVITDGYENASETKLETVKEMIKSKEELGWKILFLAANIDEKAVAGGLGIKQSNVTKFSANVDGYTRAMCSATMSVSEYRRER